ncbi:ArsR/SmtB family transcription factor [Oceanomicrobium pacificus]|uniref:Metalloregulator ArsR/SmtB family transcription factor n=1 Tax=Oceanomicrobium pacificus TaxID=2692916 RepID=A0A6B0TSU8_9RHOB|nr:metalloregulator ArsR/SmtB family transcription factor [Oceanomicrobium pacificus]MXU64292.1 metalloregulator ArsR/SmtB family transcription factor [Oceanomicrobium pacificus]
MRDSAALDIQDKAPAMAAQAAEAAEFIKTLGHEGRLMLLCLLSQGERTVSELEAETGARQAIVSQHLARLRQEGFVSTRRDGRQIFYSLADPRVAKLISTLYEIFCDPA